MQRWLFRRELEKLGDRPGFYLDEYGVDHRLYRAHARAPRGEPVYQAVSGKNRKRTSIIAASRHGKLVAPLMFQGSCNGAVVALYFETMLLPQLPPGSVIVLDNAGFHQSPKLVQLVADAGCHLLFLPAYSPDFAPIEHLWAALKTRLRKNLASVRKPFLFIADMCLFCC